MRTLARTSDKAELLHRIRRVRPDSAAQWGRMSAHQMMCHLTDSFRMATGLKHARDVYPPGLRVLVKWTALYLPVRWPPGISTRPEIDQEIGGTRPVDFAADRAELESLLDAVSRPDDGLTWASKHPAFGSMSPAEWLRWAYIHTDHHLRQFGV